MNVTLCIYINTLFIYVFHFHVPLCLHSLTLKRFFILYLFIFFFFKEHNGALNINAKTLTRFCRFLKAEQINTGFYSTYTGPANPQLRQSFRNSFTS